MVKCKKQKIKNFYDNKLPYPHFGVADGIAFSCSLTQKLQPSLKNIFDAIDATVYEGVPRKEHDLDLSRWSRQGVLLLNTALTTQIDKVGTHYDIWKDFIMYTLDMLSLTNSGLIFILLGAKAQELESVITPAHYVLKASHPASAAYTKTTWDCNDVFNKANELLAKNNGPEYKIEW